MNLRQVMRQAVLTATPDESAADAARVMAAARVRHVPVVEDDRLLGMWLATGGGDAVRVNADRVHQATPDEDALDALSELVGGREAVLVWEGGRPVGILTRADVIELVRRALGDVRSAAVPPVVVRLVGPAGAGKSTLIARTVPLLRRCEVGVIQANPQGTTPQAQELAGVPVIADPHAHWRKGLRAAVERLSGVGLIVVEDRDSPAKLEAGLGEDAQVLVAPAADLGGLDDATLRQAQAVVVTKVDEAPAGLDVARALGVIADRHPQLAMFPVSATTSDEGLAEWREWIEALVLRRRR